MSALVLGFLQFFHVIVAAEKSFGHAEPLHHEISAKKIWEFNHPEEGGEQICRQKQRLTLNCLLLPQNTTTSGALLVTLLSTGHISTT